MKYYIGRENFAATIYVPYDCANNCPFCTSKVEYRKHKPDVNAVLAALEALVRNPAIKDIVFTGGEPTADIELLNRMIYMARGKNIFINTTLPSTNFFKFLSTVNEGYVTGVNISRHATSFAEDSKLFHSIVDDWAIDGFKVPVKINAVVTEETTLEDIQKIVDRWAGKENVTLCFRHDFRTMTPEKLHVLNGDKVLDYLGSKYSFVSHSFCDVCDTVRFKERIAYHRGLEHSSFKFGNTVIVNDVIVFPDGFIAYDWDRKSVSELDGFMTVNTSKKKRTPSTRNLYECSNNPDESIRSNIPCSPGSCGVGCATCGGNITAPRSCGYISCGVSFGSCGG